MSRLTGVLRIAAIGAVLGPTLLGNAFQFTNSLPNLVYYGFLAGSLFSSLLVPTLVRTLDAGDRLGSERIAGGFLGVALGALTLAAGAAMVLGPLALRAGAVGTQDAAAQAAQGRAAQLLVLLLAPQVLLYAVVGTSAAVMNARRRFALAAAAPALENLGVLVVLGVAAARYGTSADAAGAPVGELVLLGAGSTAAVAVHAAVQWYGARRAGVTLLPRAGWRDPDVRALVRRALPALALAGTTALQPLVLLVLANRVAGGVVAVQMGLTFYTLVVALGITPVALSVLPRLSRMHVHGDREGFGETLANGLALVLFVTVPAAVGYVLVARPLGEVIAVGRMSSHSGALLIAVTIATLAPGLVGDGVFKVLTYACYARQDMRTPVRAMGGQAVVFLVLAGCSLLVPVAAVPLVLGIAWSLANTVGAWRLAVTQASGLRSLERRLGPGVVRVVAGAALMAVPVAPVVVLVPRVLEGRAGWLVAGGAAVVLGTAVFLLVQAWLRAPELSWLTRGLIRPRQAPARGVEA
ncbi:murein biosynthesis integral membrane protein MurJ [Petropleomorpha daqingensis]|uniref:Putative peptidoglycan lipid II flippase n=1 Tax=Petropleomorpha daqingensis TaxID=2026353 RepID=A0A853CIP2_9ACTN|nr:putative peptidoglycan lipid II flippase [Petropleomorpha daqingensis]